MGFFFVYIYIRIRRGIMNYQNSKIKTVMNYIQQNIFKILLLTFLVAVLLYVIVPKRQSSTDYVKLFESSLPLTSESTEEPDINTDLAIVPGLESIEEVKENQVIYVDIKGAVEHPDMYSLPLGSRVYDAIEMAGGVTMDAATEHLNQAKLLEDQMLIYIQTYEELENEEMTGESQTLENNQGIILETNLLENNNSGVIDINSATADELMTLPNIGPKKAAAIVQFRQDNGSFIVIEDIMAISGIGEKTFESLKELITVWP